MCMIGSKPIDCENLECKFHIGSGSKVRTTLIPVNGVIPLAAVLIPACE